MTALLDEIKALREDVQSLAPPKGRNGAGCASAPFSPTEPFVIENTGSERATIVHFHTFEPGERMECRPGRISLYRYPDGFVTTGWIDFAVEYRGYRYFYDYRRDAEKRGRNMNAL